MKDLIEKIEQTIYSNFNIKINNGKDCKLRKMAFLRYHSVESPNIMQSIGEPMLLHNM